MIKIRVVLLLFIMLVVLGVVGVLVVVEILVVKFVVMLFMLVLFKEFEVFMKGFEGSWKCEMKFVVGLMGLGLFEMMMKSLVKIKKDFDGFLWYGEYKVVKMKIMFGMSGVF